MLGLWSGKYVVQTCNNWYRWTKPRTTGHPCRCKQQQVQNQVHVSVQDIDHGLKLKPLHCLSTLKTHVVIPLFKFKTEKSCRCKNNFLKWRELASECVPARGKPVWMAYNYSIFITVSCTLSRQLCSVVVIRDNHKINTLNLFQQCVPVVNTWQISRLHLHSISCRSKAYTQVGFFNQNNAYISSTDKKSILWTQNVCSQLPKIFDHFNHLRNNYFDKFSQNYSVQRNNFHSFMKLASSVTETSNFQPHFQNWYCICILSLEKMGQVVEKVKDLQYSAAEHDIWVWSELL